MQTKNSLEQKNRFHSLLQLIAGLLVVSFVLAAPAWGFRGGGKGKMKDPEQIIANMKTRLELTDEQVDQSRPVIETRIEKQKAIFEKYKDAGRDERQSMRSEMKTLRDDTDQQLKGILTETQMEEYLKLREERREKRRGKMRGSIQG